MPQHTHAEQRICHDCDGYGSAVITTGLRHLDGSRHTMPVNCPACCGLGTIGRVLVTTKAA